MGPSGKKTPPVDKGAFNRAEKNRIKQEINAVGGSRCGVKRKNEVKNGKAKRERPSKP